MRCDPMGWLCDSDNNQTVTINIIIISRMVFNKYIVGIYSYTSQKINYFNFITNKYNDIIT